MGKGSITSPESAIAVTHANIGMGLDHKSNGMDSWWAMGAFFFSRNPENIYGRAKIQQAIEPIFAIGGDILGFTEVFGKQQVAYISNQAEQKGYCVIAYPSFEMSNQSEEGEHLYNVILSRERIDPNNIQIDSFIHPRPDFYKLIKFLNKLPLGKKWSLNGSYWYPSNKRDANSVQNAHNRLLTGVLDGAFATIKLSNGTQITHGHTHGIGLDEYLNKINTPIPHMLVMDANKHPSFFTEKTPVFTGNYRSLLPFNKETETYMHAKGWAWEHIAKQVALTHPDVAYGNKCIEQTQYKIFETLSDHHGIHIRIK